MIIYNPHGGRIYEGRIRQAEGILNRIPVKHCFVTGSFLYKEKYKDIDIFVVSRTKKELKSTDKRAKITIIDFNDTYSLFYHSISKSCISKSILPQKPLKATLSDYWQVINEAIPTLMNQKDRFHKNVRFLVLYTEYFKSGEVLDTLQLAQKINTFKNYKEVIEYVKSEVPKAVSGHAKPSYARRLFYTQAGYYKSLCEYTAQSFLYNLAHEAARGAAHG